MIVMKNDLIVEEKSKEKREKGRKSRSRGKEGPFYVEGEELRRVVICLISRQIK